MQLVASRWPLRLLPPDSVALDWPERLLSVGLDTPWDEIDLHNTHVPNGAANGWKKVEVLEGIYRCLASPAEHPRILCGDFNAPQCEFADGSLVTWAAQRVWDGSYQIKRGYERSDLAERNVLQGRAAFDLSDVYRTLHGYERADFSWYWRAARALAAASTTTLHPRPCVPGRVRTSTTCGSRV